MKERTPTLVGLAVLLIAVAAVAAALLGPSSNKLDASRPDVGSDPGIGSTTSIKATRTPHGGPTTFPGTVPLQVTTTEPTSTTATTFPGPAPTFYTPPKLLPPTTSLTATVPAPTTTIPNRPDLPSPDSITSVCGGAVAVQSLQSVFFDPTEVVSPADAQGLMNLLLADLSKYLSVSPPTLVPDYTTIINAVTAIDGQVQTHGWNTKDPAVIATVQAISAGTPPFQDVLPAGRTIQKWESEHCH